MSHKNLKDALKLSGTEVFKFIDAVFQDRFPLLADKIVTITDHDITFLWNSNPEILEILKESTDLEDAREKLYEYLNICEKEVFSSDSDLHPLEKANIRECVRVFRSIIGPINEKRTQRSAIDILWRLARDEMDKINYDISRGFILEFVHLFRGIIGNSGIYSSDGESIKKIPEFLEKGGRKAAAERSATLDKLAKKVDETINQYPTGLDEEIRKKRENNKTRILDYFNADEEQWRNYKWHIQNVIRDESVLSQLIELTAEEKEAVQAALQNRIPFGITPYYLSLMDYDPSRKDDHAIRAQVIPPMHYIQAMKKHREDRSVMDFMGEYDTSPVDLVTRRYPKIAILKPYDTCAQICVYCQRNWEIEEVLSPHALASDEQIDIAIEWFQEHTGVSDCLVTGGDPAIMSDTLIDRLLQKLSEIDHIKRIRIGTRTPVVLPFRFTDELMEILDKYHFPGKQEICIVTHFEHPYEVTPEAMNAIQKARKLGIGFYNQEVFTVENSRRFESAALREILQLIGVDPYYNFNAKGKKETKNYRVPIARIIQEQKEEARLLPGLSRTDEAVFNVPRLGKNHLRAWEDHRVVMIMPDGRRVYEFHPWEKYISPIPPYNHYDVPIFDYLKEMEKRGENIDDYKTIWYYY
ncbi:MAG: KamA family radical SAM protein [Fidelibacterota bacterium]|nr:MAG: KamA family radical SAM protein [Candidatus Neomarinimicrobiota bacterium]